VPEVVIFVPLEDNASMTVLLEHLAKTVRHVLMVTTIVYQMAHSANYVTIHCALNVEPSSQILASNAFSTL
jgi:hypothetical protein